MKNKEKYDLSKIDMNVEYERDPYGKKSGTHKYITVVCDGEVIIDRKKINVMPYEYLLKWLEREYVSKH